MRRRRRLNCRCSRAWIRLPSPSLRLRMRRSTATVRSRRQRRPRRLHPRRCLMMRQRHLRSANRSLRRGRRRERSSVASSRCPGQSGRGEPRASRSGARRADDAGRSAPAEFFIQRDGREVQQMGLDREGVRAEGGTIAGVGDSAKDALCVSRRRCAAWRYRRRWRAADRCRARG